MPTIREVLPEDMEAWVVADRDEVAKACAIVGRVGVGRTVAVEVGGSARRVDGARRLVSSGKDPALFLGLTRSPVREVIGPSFPPAAWSSSIETSISASQAISLSLMRAYMKSR